MLQIQGYPGRPWATVAELAERLQAKHHGVVSLVALRSRRLGAARESRDDRRRVEVHLTAQGKECLEPLARLHRDELQSARAGFSVPGLSRSEGRLVPGEFS